MAENQVIAGGGRHAINPWIRLGLEAGPLIVFFIANRLEGIYVGTAWLMATTVVAIAVSFRLERRVPMMPLISCGFVVIFGALTLFMDDDVFIKIKPTFVNLLFATIILVGLVFGRTFLKILMGTVLSLTDQGWRSLSLRWGLFFIVLAVLNELVWRNFSTDFWVNFKVFGIMPLSMIFGLSQVPLIMRESTEESGAATDDINEQVPTGDPRRPETRE
ncbi:septation protein A [Fodinicurvata sp. EGI_FJ10296]|uniref:septation protein A n=1 Tax=Fodinicurvata sp. EGI_FJ10296 TaxID=3231908 RepID=UPI00345733CE